MSDDVVSTLSPEHIRQFVVLLFWRTPDDSGEGDENEVVEGHMAYLNRKATCGLCPVLGPFGDEQPLRGLSIFNSTSIYEVRALVATDPAVMARWLTAEVRPW